jgi:putative exosortase-associated protein (TIGR04073 family)
MSSLAARATERIAVWHTHCCLAGGMLDSDRRVRRGAFERARAGAVGGFFNGIGMSVARTVVGAYEIGTFWAPVPERFEPVIKPVSVFEGW